MNTHVKKHIASLVAIALAILWLVSSTFYFAYRLKSIQLDEYDKKFQEITKVNASEVRFAVQRYLNNLSAAVEFIEKYDDVTSSEITERLANIAKDNDFALLVIDVADGTGYTSDGYLVDTRIFNYDDKTRRGEPFVLDVLGTLVDNTPMVGFLVPIQGKNGFYGAALRGSIATSRLTRMFEETFVNAGGYFYIVDGNGKFVAKSESQHALLSDDYSYFENLNKLLFVEGYSAEHIKDLFVKKTSGISKYTYGGQARTCYFEPAGINDWMVMTVVPDDVIADSTKQHASNMAFFVVQLFVIFGFFICTIYITQKHAKEKALLNEKCFKALSEHTNNVVFEWDFATNNITAMSTFELLFGRKAITVNNEQDALSSKAVHEDDRDVFTEVFTAIKSGNGVTDARFRIADSEGVYHWCSLSGLVIKDKRGNPYKAIGSLKSIDEQIRKVEELRVKAESDQLTGLFNKATTERLIKDALLDQRSTSRKFALLIIDVDNFKSVNDKLGHLYGDTVLSELSQELKRLFRSNDVVGRVGGDEFFVLLQDYNHNKLLARKAASICEAFRKIYSSGDTVVKISASIGIALFPNHGRAYEELYKHADLALYDTKAKGKDGYTLYTGQQSTWYQSARTEIDSRGTIQKNFNENRVEYVFRLLYEAEKEGRNIELTLQFIAERFGFSRGYIFETDSSGLFISNTFEWCSENITPEIGNMQNLRIDIMKDAFSSFMKTGVFIVEDIQSLEDSEREVLEKQQIKSMFQFGIMENGEPVGFIGFDDCVEPRVPTDEEIDELKVVCNIFATFLVKQRITVLQKQTKDLLLDLLLNKDVMTYVIEPKTFDILYENSTMVDFVGQSHLGLKCHSSFRGEASQCSDCPCRTLSERVPVNESTIYNNKFCSQMHVVATPLEWLGQKKAYLVRCKAVAPNPHEGSGTTAEEA